MWEDATRTGTAPSFHWHPVIVWALLQGSETEREEHSPYLQHLLVHLPDQRELV